MALNQNAQYALQYLQEKYKLSPAQAAGVVGNLYAESALNTGAINRGDGRDGSNSIGIAQWNGDRARNLRAFGGDSYNTLDTQLDFVMHELQGDGKYGGGSEGAAWKRLQAATDVPSATQAFIGYERPQGWSADSPTAGHNYKGRLNYAGQLFGMSPEEIAQATPTASPAAPINIAGAATQPAQTTAVEPPKDPETWSVGKELKLPKFLPDKLFGVDTKKGLNGFGALATALSQNTQQMNQQAQQAAQTGASRRASAPPIEQTFTQSALLAPASAINGSGEVDPVQAELLKKKLLSRLGGLGGLGGYGRV